MANKGRGGRGHGKKGGHGSGGGGRGGGGGGGGGRGGFVAGQQQQQQPPQQPQVQLRLFFLTQHLILQCFNNLDDVSRKHAFEVMGWPRDNYLRRQQALRDQLENAKKEKAKQKELAAVAEDEEGETNEEGAGETANEEKAGVVEAEVGSSEATEGDLDEDKGADDAEEVTTTDDKGKGENGVQKDDNNELTSDEAKVDEVEGTEEAATINDEQGEEGDEVAKDAVEAVESADDKGENNVEVDDNNESTSEEATVDPGKVGEETAATSDEQGEDGEDEETNEAAQEEEEPEIDDNDNPLLLPLLSAPIDPQTLLDRLNTRRLYARLLYYKREQRRKVEQEASKALSGENNADGDASNDKDWMPGMGGPIQKMYRDLLKEKVTADRIWRKNLTIEELANLEWNELLKVAELRNGKKYIPYDPIPTQHELLLFSPCPRAVGILASYPRSGNSLMRTLYEHTTLRVTGSDMQGGLAKHDLVGEMAVGANMVQFVKTHFPERQGTPAFRASRVVLLVRNPFDAIESFFNLMITGEHTKSISADVRQKATKYFEEYALKEIRVWKLFHQFWMKMDVPILLIRYEDIVRWPDKVMERVVPFVLEVKRMGTFFQERIDRCIRDQQEIERLGSYKPRSGGIGKAVAKYSPELFERIINDEEFRGVMKHLHYQELLEKPPEEWSTLTPLPNYAIEYTPAWVGTGQQKVVLLNNGNLARTQNEETRWRKIKIELGIIDEKCNCAECIAEREERAQMEREAEEKKLKEEAKGDDGKEETKGEGNEAEEKMVEAEVGVKEEKVEISEEKKVDKVAVDEEKTEKETTEMLAVEEKSTGEKDSDLDDSEFQEFLNQLKEYSVKDTN